MPGWGNPNLSAVGIDPQSTGPGHTSTQRFAFGSHICVGGQSVGTMHCTHRPLSGSQTDFGGHTGAASAQSMPMGGGGMGIGMGIGIGIGAGCGGHDELAGPTGNSSMVPSWQADSAQACARRTIQFFTGSQDSP